MHKPTLNAAIRISCNVGMPSNCVTLYNAVQCVGQCVGRPDEFSHSWLQHSSCHAALQDGKGMDLDFRPERVCGGIVQHLSQTPNLSLKSEEHGVSVSEPYSSFHLHNYANLWSDASEHACRWQREWDSEQDPEQKVDAGQKGGPPA